MSSQKIKKITEEEMIHFFVKKCTDGGVYIQPSKQFLFQNMISTISGLPSVWKRKIVVVHQNRLHFLGIIDAERFFNEKSEIYSKDIKKDNLAIEEFLSLCAERLCTTTWNSLPPLENNYDEKDELGGCAIYRDVQLRRLFACY